MSSKRSEKHRFGGKKLSRREQLQKARDGRRSTSIDAGISSSAETSESVFETPDSTSKCYKSHSQSASERKLSYFAADNDDASLLGQHPVDNESNVIVTGKQLDLLIKALACPVCSNKTLSAKYSAFVGLVAKMQVFCQNCEQIVSEQLTSPLISTESKRKPHEVTRRTVASFMDNGCGYAGLEKFAMHMNMPCIHQRTFAHHSKQITEAVLSTSGELMSESAATVRKVYQEMNIESSSDGVLDISVSYDGSWHKRGHTSNFGVGCVIEIHTGLVLDFEVMSKYCHYCTFSKVELGEDTAEYQCWFEGHKDNCDINYTGPSGGMEVAAAKLIWGRSIKKHKMRYSTMLSDGDARTHKELCDMSVYGETEVIKEECVNHVSKRLGSALRNLKKQMPYIGGAGGGKLTEEKIKKLTIYYGRAIRKGSGDIVEMENAIWATFFHSTSTDEDPHHQRCPAGKDSWCFYNRALANNKHPASHNVMLGTRLDRDVAQHLIPIYKRLSSENLLKRCKAQTQNANESLHSLIWHKSPKTSFVHKNRIETSVASAISQFNKGCITVRDTLVQLGIDAGNICTGIAKQRDSERTKKSLKRVSDEAKERRQLQKIAKLKATAKESKCAKQYDPGAF